MKNNTNWILWNMLFLLTLITIDSIAQNNNEFYFQMDVASNLVKKKKLDSAILIYEKAFSTKNYIHTIFLKEVLKISKIKNDEIRITKYTTQINEQLMGTNQELIRITDSLQIEDQRVRSNKHHKASVFYWECFNDSTCDRESKKYLKAKKIREEWAEVDKSNVGYLLKLIERHGYIGEELIGKHSYKFYVMLLHYDRDTNNRILLPILNEALEDGSILPKEYALILDRHSFFQNNTQKYWTWPCRSMTERLPFLESDVAVIKKNRESIGIYNSGLWQENTKGYWILRNKYTY